MSRLLFYCLALRELFAAKLFRCRFLLQVFMGYIWGTNDDDVQFPRFFVTLRREMPLDDTHSPDIVSVCKTACNAFSVPLAVTVCGLRLTHCAS